MVINKISTLIAGSAFAQFISFAAAPILTRLYSPEDFGTLSILSGWVGVLAVLVTGKYSEAIVLQKKESDAVNLFALSVIITVIFFSLTGLFLYLYSEQIRALHDLKKIYDWYCILILLVLVNGLQQAASGWVNRGEKYNTITACKVIQVLAISTTAIVMPIVGFGGGLIWGELAGALLACVYIYYEITPDLKSLGGNVSMGRMKELSMRHVVFPTINLLHSLSDVFQVTGVVFLISINYGDRVLGCYALAMKVMRAPISMITSSVAQVLYVRLINDFNSGRDMRVLLNKFMIIVGVGVLPVYTALMLFGAPLFEYLFGSQWRDAGVYVQLLSPWVGLSVISSVMSFLPLIVGEQKKFFIISLIGNSIPIIVFLLLPYIDFEILASLRLLGCVMVIHASLSVVWLYRLSNRKYMEA